MFSVCVGVMGEVWFSFFLMYLFHASVLYTCFFHAFTVHRFFIAVYIMNEAIFQSTVKYGSLLFNSMLSLSHFLSTI